MYSIIILLGIAAGGAVLMTIYNPFNSAGRANSAQLNLPANGPPVNAAATSLSTSTSSTTTNASITSTFTNTSPTTTNSTGLLSNPPPSSGGGGDDGSQHKTTNSLTRTGDD